MSDPHDIDGLTEFLQRASPENLLAFAKRTGDQIPLQVAAQRLIRALPAATWDDDDNVVIPSPWAELIRIYPRQMAIVLRMVRRWQQVRAEGDQPAGRQSARMRHPARKPKPLIPWWQVRPEGEPPALGELGGLYEQSQREVQRLQGEVQRLRREQREVNKFKREVRAVFAAMFATAAGGGLAYGVQSWPWLASHPNQYGIVGCWMMILAGVCWAIVDRRNWKLSLVAVAFGAALIIMQLLGGPAPPTQRGAGDGSPGVPASVLVGHPLVVHFAGTMRAVLGLPAQAPREPTAAEPANGNASGLSP